MGRLKPDVLVLRGEEVTAVIDAKYKRLVLLTGAAKRRGPADLYQLAAYARQYQPEQVAALVYPHDRSTEPAHAEALGPWHGAATAFEFRRLAPSRRPAETSLRRFWA